MAQAVAERPASTGSDGTDVRFVFHSPDFRNLWIAQIISQLAQQMINYALLVQVADVSQSSTATAGIIISFTVPAILFSAIAGVVVDRQPKKRVLVITNVLRGFVALSYLGVIWGGQPETTTRLVLLYGISLVFATVSQFFTPAEGAMIPLLVPREKLLAANALFNLTFTGSQLVGFAFLGPLLVGAIGYTPLYLGFFAAFAFCAWLTWRLPAKDAERLAAVATPADTAGAKLKLAWDDLREGWSFIRRDTRLSLAILHSAMAIAVFMMLGAIGPKFLTRVLHVDSGQLFFLMVPGGIGLVLGVVLVGRIAHERNRPTIITYSLLANGIVLFLLGLAPPGLQWLAALLQQPAPATLDIQVVMGTLAFALGLINSFISVPAQTVLQERAPEAIRARVLGAFYTVSNALLIVPILFAGGMADLLGAVQTVLLIALLVLGVAVGGLRYERRHPRTLMVEHVRADL